MTAMAVFGEEAGTRGGHLFCCTVLVDGFRISDRLSVSAERLADSIDRCSSPLPARRRSVTGHFPYPRTLAFTRKPPSRMARVRDWGLVLLFAVRVRLLYAQHGLRTVEHPSVCPIDRQQAPALSSNGARRVARRRSTLSTCGQRHVGSRRRTTALEVRVRVGYERQVSAVVIFGVQVSGEQMSYIYGGQLGAVIVMLPRCALPVCLSVCLLSTPGCFTLSFTAHVHARERDRYALYAGAAAAAAGDLPPPLNPVA